MSEAPLQANDEDIESAKAEKASPTSDKQACITPVAAPKYTPYVAGDIHYTLVPFIQAIPWHKLHGVQVLEVRPGYAKLLLPPSPHIEGCPGGGFIHGGMLAALADSCGVAALWTHFGPDDRVSTIDLRVDYLRPAPNTAGIIAEGEVRLLGGRIGNIHVRMASECDPSVTVVEGRAVCYMRRAKKA